MIEPKRMTDEEFDKELGRREAESPFKALLFASREAHRARASEAEKDKVLKECVKALRSADALFEWLIANDSLSDDGREKVHAMRAQLATVLP